MTFLQLLQDLFAIQVAACGEQLGAHQPKATIRGAEALTSASTSRIPWLRCRWVARTMIRTRVIWSPSNRTGGGERVPGCPLSGPVPRETPNPLVRFRQRPWPLPPVADQMTKASRSVERAAANVGPHAVNYRCGDRQHHLE